MRNCANCGTPFEPKYRASQQQWCSRACVRASRNGPGERWDDFEIGELEGLSNLSARQAGKVLGRSMQSVQHMRNKLRGGWSPEKMLWADDEIDVVRRTPDLTAQQVADKLGRGASGVARIRGMLSASEGIDFVNFGDKKSPFSIGGRRLLAKTCLGCGLLLDASWFGSSGKSAKGNSRWRARCSKCIQRNTDGDKYDPRSGAQRDGGKSAAESYARLQRITRDKAVRNGYPWLESDHRILRDSTLTIFEKALTLGRTWGATATALQKNGYTSRVGKGDPMKGVWHIDNPNAAEYAGAES